MERACLIIDNENQDTSVEKIVRLGKQIGIDITVKQFNVGSQELTCVLDEGKISIPKVIEYYQKNLRRFHFDLIALDWDLEDDLIDGVELMRLLKASGLLKKTPAILYSGVLKEIIKGYFETYCKDKKSFKHDWLKINSLISGSMTGFYDRNNYEDKVIELLKASAERIDLEDYFIRKLKENTTLVFNNIHPDFEGKTFGEIADILEKDESNGYRFTTELIDQTLAYLLKMNN